jgi:hypothetical protein
MYTQHDSRHRHKSQTSFRTKIDIDVNSIGSYKTEAHTKKQMELLNQYQTVIEQKTN